MTTQVAHTPENISATDPGNIDYYIPAEGITVEFSYDIMDGTAKLGEDYKITSTYQQGATYTLTDVGLTTIFFVKVVDDDQQEDDETFKFVLHTTVYYDPAIYGDIDPVQDTLTVTVVIDDDDEIEGIFTKDVDTFNFNQLTDTQKTAIDAAFDANTIDLVLYDALGGKDTITLPDASPSGGLPQLTPKVAWDLSKIFHGGPGDDTIIGGTLNDRIAGDADNDTITGGKGDDELYGSPGDDKLSGSEKPVAWEAGKHDQASLAANKDSAGFIGNFADYTITELTGGYLRVQHKNGGIDGTDTIRDIGTLSFADKDVLATSHQFEKFTARIPSGIPPAAAADINTLLALGWRWAPDAGSTHTTITYSFARDPSGFASDYFKEVWGNNFSSIQTFIGKDSNLAKAARAVFDYISSFTNITFVEVDEASGVVGTIRFIGIANLPSGIADNLGLAATLDLRKDVPVPGQGGIVGLGDIVFDAKLVAADATFSPRAPSTSDASQGLSFHVLQHEIGHALGLNHASASIMTTEEGTYNGFQPNDVAALQALYGKNTTTQASATELSGIKSSWLPANSFVFTDKGSFDETLWDFGTVETLNFSGVTSHETYMDLHQGGTIDILADQGFLARLKIAYGVVVKDVVGGDRIDTIVGNEQDNVLTGRGGNDILKGGGGSDTAAYSGLSKDYTWVSVGDGQWEVRDNRPQSPDGKDLVTDIRYLKFQDKTVDLGALPPGKFKVADGYIAGATVFADANGNGKLDAGEASATTDSTGSFTLVGGSGSLIAFGGIDTSTGLPLLGQLSAPAGSQVISPVTTLQTMGASSSSLLSALGLSTKNNLANVDPLAAARLGDRDVYEANVLLIDTVSLVAAGLAGTGRQPSTYFPGIYAELAREIVAGTTISFTDVNFLKNLIAHVAQTSNQNVSTDFVTELATAVAHVNAALQLPITSFGQALIDRLGDLQEIVQSEILSTIQGINGDATALHALQATLSIALRTVQGTVSSDVFEKGDGDQAFFGNGGHDEIIFRGLSSEYSISTDSAGNVYIVDKLADRDGTTETHGIEFLQFFDKIVFVENADNANIARLYSAALGRAPDIGGLSGWEDIYAKNISSAAKAGGVYLSLAQTDNGFGTSIAGGFTHSVEFQSRYGNLTDSGFVTQLYLNVLGRVPSSSELSAWVSLIQNGDASGTHYTREMVLVGFAESPENIAKTTADWLIQI